MGSEYYSPAICKATTVTIVVVESNGLLTWTNFHESVVKWLVNGD